MVDEYAIEIFLLLTRNEIIKTDEQLVFHFIGDLRLHFQNILNLFDPATIFKAHQRALLIEHQNWAGSILWTLPTSLALMLP